MIRQRGTIMTTIKAQLSGFELETRYEAAADPVGKRSYGEWIATDALTE